MSDELRTKLGAGNTRHEQSDPRDRVEVEKFDTRVRVRVGHETVVAVCSGVKACACDDSITPNEAAHWHDQKLTKQPRTNPHLPTLQKVLHPIDLYMECEAVSLDSAASVVMLKDDAFTEPDMPNTRTKRSTRVAPALSHASINQHPI